MSPLRTTRSPIPSPASLGLTRPTAADDLAALGWDDEEHLDLLGVLSSVGDPDRALNAVVRLVETLDGDGVTGEASAKALLAALGTDPAFRIRLLALFGGSTLLGDHVIANPHIWPRLTGNLPEREEIMAELIGSVGAVPGQYHRGRR